jgi:DNA polymerase-3 subunit beta
MKTTFNTSELTTLLKATKCLKGDILPDLYNFHLSVSNGWATFTVTDLDTFVTKRFEATGEINTCLPREIVLKHLSASKTLTTTIELTHVNKAVVNGLTMPCYDVEEYPLTKSYNTEAKGLMFSGALMLEIKAALPYLGNDELRPVMTGVYVSNEKGFHDVVATNSHVLSRSRLGECSADEEKYEMLFNPRNVVKIVDGLKIIKDNVSVLKHENHIVFTYYGLTIVHRTIDGKYPNYEAVIPTENPVQVTFNCNELANAINAVKVASSNSVKKVNFVFNETGCVVSAEDVDHEMYMEQRVNCNYNEDFTIAFNYVFLLEALKNCLTHDVTFEMSTSNRAMVMNSGHRTLLTMPVMITPKKTTEEEEVEVTNA